MMDSTTRRLLSLLILFGLGGCIPDELKYEYEWLDSEKLEFGRKYPLENLFPGNWKHVCIANPGEESMKVVEELAPQYRDARWAGDGRLYDSDFTTAIYKIVLMNDNNFKIYMMSHGRAHFTARSCYVFENKAIEVKRSSVSPRNTDRYLQIEETEPEVRQKN